MKSILIIILFLSILSQVFNKSIRKNDSRVEIDFKSEVIKFCLGKSKNFCSEKHIQLMFMIEEKRLQELEMARQMKRMEAEIIRNIFKMDARYKKQ